MAVGVVHYLFAQPNIVNTSFTCTTSSSAPTGVCNICGNLYDKCCCNFKSSYPPNDNRKHTRGFRGKRRIEYNRRFGASADNENLYAKKLSMRARDRGKISQGKKREFRERGLHERRGNTNKPKKQSQELRRCQLREYRTERAHQLRVHTRVGDTTTDTNLVSRRRKLLKNLVPEERPEESTIPKIEFRYLTVRHVLSRFKRDGTVPFESADKLPCCTTHVKLVNKESGFLSNSQLKSLLNILLQRGCVETHPGPRGKKGSKDHGHCERKQGVKAGTHRSKHLRMTTVPIIIKTFKKTPKLDAPPTEEEVTIAAAVEAENASNHTTTTSSAASEKVVSGRKFFTAFDDADDNAECILGNHSEDEQSDGDDSSSDEEPEKAKTPILDGHHCTDAQVRAAVMLGWSGDPSSVKRESFLMSPKHESRPLLDRGVKACDSPFVLETWEFDAVDEMFNISKLPQLLLAIRAQGTFYGCLYLAYLLFRYYPIYLSIGLITGYWFASVFRLVFVLIALNTGINQILGVISRSNLVWRRVKVLFVPHMLTCILRENSDCRDPDTANLDQCYLRNASISIPAAIAVDCKINTCKIARHILPLIQGFRPIGDSGEIFDTSSVKSFGFPSSLSDSCVIQPLGHVETESPDTFSKISKAFSANIQDPCGRALAKSSRMVRGIAKQAYKTYQIQRMEIDLVHRLNFLRALRTSVNYPGEQCRAILRSASTGMTLRRYVWASIDELVALLNTNASLGPSNYFAPIQLSTLKSLEKLSTLSSQPINTLMAFGLVKSVNLNSEVHGNEYDLVDQETLYHIKSRDLLSSSLTGNGNTLDGLIQDATSLKCGLDPSLKQ